MSHTCIEKSNRTLCTTNDYVMFAVTALLHLPALCTTRKTKFWRRKKNEIIEIRRRSYRTYLFHLPKVCTIYLVSCERINNYKCMSWKSKTLKAVRKPGSLSLTRTRSVKKSVNENTLLRFKEPFPIQYRYSFCYRPSICHVPSIRSQKKFPLT